LQISVDMRQQGLKHYTGVFRKPDWEDFEDVPDHVIYMNVDVDTAYVFVDDQPPTVQKNWLRY
jgi:hypothetical protein